MSVRLRCFLLLSTILMVAPAAFGQPTIVNFDFGAVRIVCSNGYAYEGPVLSCPYAGPSQNFNANPAFGWVLGMTVAYYGHPQQSLDGGPGLTGPNTIFYPPPFDGLPFNQAVILQDEGSFVFQAVRGFTSGNYTLSFYLGSRYSNLYDGNQTVEALIDGQVIGTWALSSYTPFTLQTASFSVTTDGTHTVEFRGMNHGDHTAFLSYVTIIQTGEP
jgi:hypothetical protein